MNNFGQLKTTQLGELAEAMIASEFCKSKGYSPFGPLMEGSHMIDCVMISGSSVCYLDLKCKSKRKYYPDTGFDTADVEKYMTYYFPVYILWADIVQKKIYGNWLKKLIPHKKVEGVITYFPLDKMIFYRDMTQEEFEQLKTLENNKYINK